MSDWESLAREVRRRRGVLRLRQTDMERRGGPSAGTMRNIEQAGRTSYAVRTFVQLETALEWPDGVVGKILDGSAGPDDLYASVPRRGATPLAVSMADRGLTYRPTPASISHAPQSAISDDDLALRIGRVVLALVHAEEGRPAGDPQPREGA